MTKRTIKIFDGPTLKQEQGRAVDSGKSGSSSASIMRRRPGFDGNNQGSKNMALSTAVSREIREAAK